MAETYPISAAISWENLLTNGSTTVDNSTATETAWDGVSASLDEPLYPKSNLLIPNRSKGWRTTSTTSGGGSLDWVSVSFTLDSAKHPGVFAFIDSNLDNTSESFLLEASNEATFSGSELSYTRWVFNNKPVSNRNIARWYFKDSTPVIGGWHSYTTRKYWRFSLPYKRTSERAGNGFFWWTGGDLTSEAYFRMNNIWLGEYSEFRPSDRTRIDVIDNSTREVSRDGSIYSDRKNVYHSIGLEVDFLNQSEMYTMRNNVETSQGRPILLDLHANSTDVNIQKYSTYYGLMTDKSPAKVNYKTVSNNSIKLSFEEMVV